MADRYFGLEDIYLDYPRPNYQPHHIISGFYEPITAEEVAKAFGFVCTCIEVPNSKSVIVTGCVIHDAILRKVVDDAASEPMMTGIVQILQDDGPKELSL